MFLYENWVKQSLIIGKTKKLLPNGCVMKNIEFNNAKNEYRIMLDYNGKFFRATIEYPFFYLSEKGVRALGSLNISSRKDFEKNKSFIKDYMS